MERYLGLDVHAASSTLVVLSEAGRRLKRCVLETNGQALVEAIRMIPGRKHLCFEEGTQSAWLYEILSPQVQETVVAMLRCRYDRPLWTHGMSSTVHGSGVAPVTLNSGGFPTGPAV